MLFRLRIHQRNKRKKIQIEKKNCLIIKSCIYTVFTTFNNTYQQNYFKTIIIMNCESILIS